MQRNFLFLTVFIAGMAVMAVELTASRLLAPYFGSSLFVWTNLIGIVLLALSLGYFLGGKLADRKGGQWARRDLFVLILCAGLLIGVTPWIAGPVFRFSYQTLPHRDLSIFFPSLLSILALFTLPLLFLGMVAPLAARIGIREVDSAGRIVGSLYALSTAGSLVGTFLPVLVTIPFLGSRRTFFLFGAVLILLGGIGLKRSLATSVVALPFLLFSTIPHSHGLANTVFEKESVYNLVRVQELPQTVRILTVNEGIGGQSVYHPSRVLTGDYWDGAALLPVLYPGGKNFLFVGLSGGTSARLISHFFPSLELEGVEIDPVIVEAGKEFFGLDRIPIEIQTGDGRVFLEQTLRSYDFVMIDVYHDNFFIPFHLATREFFERVRSRLTPRGVVVMNVFSPTPDSELLRLLKNTVSAVFPSVYEYRQGKTTSLLYAFQEDPASSGGESPPRPPELDRLVSKTLEEWRPVRFDPGGGVSEDDRPTVELLSAQSIFLKRPDVIPLLFRK